MTNLNYLWRILGTGLCFCLFGLGGVVLTTLVFPVVNLTTKDATLRHERSQKLIHRTFRCFVFLLSGFGLFRFHLSGHEALKGLKGILIIANHPTLIDVVVMMSMMDKAQCVVKAALFDNKFLGGPVRAAGYIRNNEDPEELLRACEDILERGENVILFPEGTRSKPNQKLKFKRGFANVALGARADLCMLKIKCNPITLSKGVPWYKVPSRRADFVVSYDQIWEIEPYLRQERKSIAVRHLTKDIETYYNESRLDG
ncbi:lysophospholipid acyltransferase family protein [Curvivirga aplysinae]|uniref:lysophospholipid acyltransferase family protein n=1 Tax=Curvivirga aplysinae TaxID=2529852 RepID=UPI0012BB8502|nr:lysophospholipid acyltransferase family protein [Curvivirga aplysinae]MTI11035.1 1-acyl-sn-glycerol-3-phosphate acyltransferase [Curvivirga aplysinae]